jgi:uncharacterized membrane protein
MLSITKFVVAFQIYPIVKYHRNKIYKNNTMKKNMGSADRIIRVMIAAILITLYFTGTITGTVGIILIVLSVIFVLTSLIGFCPLYLPFGLSTLRKKIHTVKQ